MFQYPPPPLCISYALALAAPFRNSEHTVLAPDGAVSDICQRLHRTILVEGVRLSVGTYCWTFHRSADKLRPCPSYSRRRGRINLVPNFNSVPNIVQPHKTWVW